jgi:hypothetical protein
MEEARNRGELDVIDLGDSEMLLGNPRHFW